MDDSVVEPEVNCAVEKVRGGNVAFANPRRWQKDVVKEKSILYIACIDFNHRSLLIRAYLFTSEYVDATIETWLFFYGESSVIVNTDQMSSNDNKSGYRINFGG